MKWESGSAAASGNQATLEFEAFDVAAHQRSARSVSAACCSALESGVGPRSDAHFGIEIL